MARKYRNDNICTYNKEEILMQFPTLFSPITLRGLTLSNRIQRTSMVSGLATEDGHVTDDLIARYEREAKGGVGSIVVEAAVVLPSRSSYNLRISDDSFTDGLKQFVRQIRSRNWGFRSCIF